MPWPSPLRPAVPGLPAAHAGRRIAVLASGDPMFYGIGRALIDATHPFAGTISFNVAKAAATARVPLLALRRPGWVPEAGDVWHEAGCLEEAAVLLPSLGRRMFLTTGRMGLAAFAALDDLWFLVRSVGAPEAQAPSRMEVLLDRGPFTLDGERELPRRHRIDVVVTKDSGGAATAPKLTAAREAGLPVVVVRRPSVPEGVQVLGEPEQALRWIRPRATSTLFRVLAET
ncbi:precorrin-6A/cobalt-precorrin-6A reductase [Streptomyces sp. FL07-04A]|nr:precorrin-6A/cobalt-precorrin-6A reductase [Streptomyces sp. FL07-04A]MDX3576754.1 precorrin-6A/cobalt-precorrin-6A reductase [Streptomyces sp. FL07-04A]